MIIIADNQIRLPVFMERIVFYGKYLTQVVAMHLNFHLQNDAELNQYFLVFSC